MSFYWREEHKKQIVKHINKHILGLDLSCHSVYYPGENAEKNFWEKQIHNFDELKKEYLAIDKFDYRKKLSTKLAQFYCKRANYVTEQPDSMYFYITDESREKDSYFSLDVMKDDVCVCLQKSKKPIDKFHQYVIHSCMLRQNHQQTSELIAVFVSTKFHFKYKVKCSNTEIQKSIDETKDDLAGYIKSRIPLISVDSTKLAYMGVKEDLKLLDKYFSGVTNSLRNMPEIAPFDKNYNFLFEADDDTEMPLISIALFNLFILKKCTENGYSEDEVIKLKKLTEFNDDVYYKSFIKDYVRFVLIPNK